MATNTRERETTRRIEQIELNREYDLATYGRIVVTDITERITTLGMKERVDPRGVEDLGWNHEPCMNFFVEIEPADANMVPSKEITATEFMDLLQKDDE